MDWFTIINNLLPLIPGANTSGITGDAVTLSEEAFKLIQRIKAQSGKTTDEILDQAGVTLDENKKMLLDDLERLEGANP